MVTADICVATGGVGERYNMVARLLLFPINATSISGLESLPH